MTIIGLWDRDPRLQRVCESSFPDNPELVAYLIERFRAYKATEAVARLIASMLVGAVREPVLVSEDQRMRLAVDDDCGATARLLRAYGNTLDGLMMICVLRLKSAARKNSISEDDRLHSGIDDEMVENYTRVMVCAVAMLQGVELDPRQEAA